VVGKGLEAENLRAKKNLKENSNCNNKIEIIYSGNHSSSSPERQIVSQVP
jgi:hypothetical protein